MTTYTVQSGDTFATIAKKFLGDSQRYKEVIAVNPQVADPNLIKVGEVLNIPDTSSATVAPPRGVASSFAFPSLIPSAQASDVSTSTDGSSFMDKIKGLAQNKPLLIGVGVSLAVYLYLQSKRNKK